MFTVYAATEDRAEIYADVRSVKWYMNEDSEDTLEIQTTFDTVMLNFCDEVAVFDAQGKRVAEGDCGRLKVLH